MANQQIKEQADNKVLEILLKSEQKDFYGATLDQYNYSDHTPISPIYMPNVRSNHNVVITENVHKSLMKIKQITEQTNCEVSFFLFGDERENGTVWLNGIVSDYKPLSRVAVDFEPLNPLLNDFVESIQESPSQIKNVIVHGHTHSQSHANDNFSFDDLSAYVQMANLHPLFQSRQVETVGMLLAPHGDFNFIMYENCPEYEGFYKFPTVYMRTNNGNGHELPAYQNGNYIVNQQSGFKHN